MDVDAFLLDTSVVSAYCDAGNPRHVGTRAYFAARPAARLYTCPVTLGEIEYGLLVSPAADAQRHAAVREALAGFEVLPIDRHTRDPYAIVRANLFRTYAPRKERGRLRTKHVEDLVDRTTGRELGIQENDLWLVAVAVQYDLKLATWDAMRRLTVAGQGLLKLEPLGRA